LRGSPEAAVLDKPPRRVRGTAADVARDAVVVIAVAAVFGPGEARMLSRRVRDASQAGERLFVVDLTEAARVAEAPLMITLLSVRSALIRNAGRLVVAAEPALACRIATGLRLDEVIGAAASRDAAIEQALTPHSTRCESCGTGWHSRRAGHAMLFASTCARCGGQLTDESGHAADRGRR
jgi:hypothetical protein